MELNIKNFSKIKEANIIINGITVIAGENNTGKSTIGKILFSSFNSTKNIFNEIYESKSTPVLTNLKNLMEELSQNNEEIKKLMPQYDIKSMGIFGFIAAMAATVIGGLPLAAALLSGLGTFNLGYNIENVKKEKADIENINDLIVNIIIDLTNENDKKIHMML